MYADRRALATHPLENTMMNRIRTALEAKRTNSQLQSFYAWRPGPGRK